MINFLGYEFDHLFDTPEWKLDYERQKEIQKIMSSLKDLDPTPKASRPEDAEVGKNVFWHDIPLNERYESVCNDYLRTFAAKISSSPLSAPSWVADRVGWLAMVDGEVYEFRDVRAVVDGNLSVKLLLEFREYNVTAHRLNLPYVTLDDYKAGKYVRPEAIERLEQMKRDLDNAAKEEWGRVKNEKDGKTGYY